MGLLEDEARSATELQTGPDGLSAADASQQNAALQAAAMTIEATEPNSSSADGNGGPNNALELTSEGDSFVCSTIK